MTDLQYSIRLQSYPRSGRAMPVWTLSLKDMTLIRERERESERASERERKERRVLLGTDPSGFHIRVLGRLPRTGSASPNVGVICKYTQRSTLIVVVCTPGERGIWGGDDAHVPRRPVTALYVLSAAKLCIVVFKYIPHPLAAQELACLEPLHCTPRHISNTLATHLCTPPHIRSKSTQHSAH